jgi:signal transduction histidine kinase
VAALQQAWQKRETARAKTRDWLRDLAGRSLPADHPGELWLGEGVQSVLALTNPTPGGGWDVAFVPVGTLVTALKKTLLSIGGLPDYAGAVVEIGRERRRLAGTPAADAEPPVLADVDGILTVGKEHPFNLRLDLSNPEPLYTRYQQRRRVIEGLIFFAAGTALLSLVTLWTGHRRETRLNEMKSNFLSSVSHELRAPIAAVRLMAESLESGRVNGPPRQQDYYHLIVQECRRLSALVGNVLDVARIDQGKQSYRFEPVNAMSLLRHTVMLMQPNAEQRHVQLVLTEPAGDLEDRQPTWDGEAVEQSLVNLLDNAIQHSPEGTKVLVEMEVCHDLIRLWIRDRGPGIPVEEHQRIFERFYRLGQELRRESRGVGIGLSIVKHVAEGHGGRVLIESIVGEGSSFGLELPLDAGAPS